MLTLFDFILDRVTMYRLVLYYLIGVLCYAGILSLFGLLPFGFVSLFFTVLILLAVCYLTNFIFAKVFAVPTNVESVYITALILACIITPLHTFHDLSFILWAGVLAIASKYILVLNKKHIFNPAAIGLLIASIGLEHSPSWWIGNLSMMPIVLIGGLMIMRKTRREDMVFSFFLTTLTVIGLFAIVNNSNLITTYQQVLFHSSLLFFAFVMLTEPLTSPPTQKFQMIYAAFVGIVFPPQVHLGGIYSTPEIALVIGNVFSYFVSPKQKLTLFLKEKIAYSASVIDFVFHTQERLRFQPGQYLEWTLQHPHTDSRGNRRYFTIASSPTEEDLRLGVKFYDKGSSYKRALKSLSDASPIVASQVAGDFTLPKDQKKKLVFLAGGIGITPFRSMLKYLLDTNEKRDIVMLYSAKSADELVYRDVIADADNMLGIKTIYTLTDQEHLPPSWTGEVGRISPDMIKKYIPDFYERVFYLSGPHVMVEGFAETLRDLGVKKDHIKKDFFPGFV